MTSSHRYSKSAVGVVIVIIYHNVNPSLHPVAEKSVDMETLVDDFVTFYIAGR